MTRFPIALFLTIIVTGTSRAEPLDAKRLTKMSWSALECLYRQGDACEPPCGYYRGRTIASSSRPFSRMRNRLAGAVWRGKHFGCGVITNQWTGFKALRGEVYRGTSLIDGKPAIILDYRSTSVVWRKVHDEIRRVAPGLYLGVMHEEDGCEVRMRTFFVLESACR